MSTSETEPPFDDRASGPAWWAPETTAVVVDAAVLRAWLTDATRAGLIDVDWRWTPTAEHVAELVDALADDDGDLARHAWRLAPDVAATFTYRLAGGGYLFGADIVDGGRVCTMPCQDFTLNIGVRLRGVDAAVVALLIVAGLLERANATPTASRRQSPGARPRGAARAPAAVRELLTRLNTAPADDFATPDGFEGGLSYRQLRAIPDDQHATADTFAEFRAWREDMAPAVVTVGDVLRRFPDVALTMLCDWITLDLELTAASIADTEA